MSVENYFSETVKGIVQNIFPDVNQLFDKDLKGTLVNFTPPCGKKVCLAWAFPIQDGEDLDHIIYEQISGRAYMYVGSLCSEQCKVNDVYEDRTKIIRVLEKNGEICTEVVDKKQKFQEKIADEIWNEELQKDMKQKYADAQFYKHPIACICNDRNIWLVGVTNSSENEILHDIFIIDGDGVSIESNVVFENITLAMPNNKDFF